MRNIDLGKEIHKQGFCPLNFECGGLTFCASECLEKSGLVKEDAFFTILKLHGIDLGEAEKNRLKKAHSRAGKINFSDALQEITIDLDTAVLNEEKWIVSKQAVGGKSQEAQNSLMPGKAISHLSRMSLAEFNER